MKQYHPNYVLATKFQTHDSPAHWHPGRFAGGHGVAMNWWGAGNGRTDIRFSVNVFIIEIVGRDPAFGVFVLERVEVVFLLVQQGAGDECSAFRADSTLIVHIIHVNLAFAIWAKNDFHGSPFCAKFPEVPLVRNAMRD
ncbi:MAG: hypothetical protein WCH61_10820 [bacterium]